MPASPRTRNISGVLLRVADDQPTFWDRVEAGLWEPETLALLAREVGPGTTFLDVGAWVGALSLYAAARGARVVAVEADPAALDQFRRNLAANPDLGPQVSLVSRAVAASSGPVRLGSRRKPGDSMSSTLLAETSATAWTVDAVTPVELAALLPVEGPALVKLDVEGAEYALLPALAPLLARPGSRFLISFHPGILRAADPAGARARTQVALAALAACDAYALQPGGPLKRPLTATALESCETWYVAPRQVPAHVTA